MWRHPITKFGYFIIADISGYTKFVTETEALHAKGILEQLFSSMIKTIKAPLAIAGFQGDAIFAYSLDDDLVSKQYLLDFVEKIYCGFAGSRDKIQINSGSKCNACGGVSALDLKVVIHYGEYLEQETGQGTELLGKDVNKAFRLLKNSVHEELGFTAYTLLPKNRLPKWSWISSLPIVPVSLRISSTFVPPLVWCILFTACRKNIATPNKPRSPRMRGF